MSTRGTTFVERPFTGTSLFTRSGISLIAVSANGGGPGQFLTGAPRWVRHRTPCAGSHSPGSLYSALPCLLILFNAFFLLTLFDYGKSYPIWPALSSIHPQHLSSSRWVSVTFLHTQPEENEEAEAERSEEARSVPWQGRRVGPPAGDDPGREKRIPGKGAEEVRAHASDQRSIGIWPGQHLSSTSMCTIGMCSGQRACSSPTLRPSSKS
jgi:hypothetical protein